MSLRQWTDPARKIKCSIQKLEIPKPESAFIKKQLKILNANELPINIDHSCEIINLPFIHKDPFDRMIIAQANIENFTIITKDQLFKDYEVKILA